MTAGSEHADGHTRPPALARVVVRPIANPLPVGFLALAVATFVVSGLELGWIGQDEKAQVALVLLGGVFPLQLLSAAFGFLSRDVAAPTAMGILAGTWFGVGAILLASPPGATSDTLGLLLLVSAIALLCPAVTAAAGKLVVAAVLAVTVLRFAVTGVYQLTDVSAWQTLAGVVGLAVAAVALYASLALALEDEKRRTVLPTFRRGAGRAAIAESLEAELGEVHHEAGVREQL